MGRPSTTRQRYTTTNGGMSYDEIAAILDITNESVRKLVYRSLESLREKMPGFNYKDLIILLIIVSRSSGL